MPHLRRPIRPVVELDQSGTRSTTRLTGSIRCFFSKTHPSRGNQIIQGSTESRPTGAGCDGAALGTARVTAVLIGGLMWAALNPDGLASVDRAGARPVNRTVLAPIRLSRDGTRFIEAGSNRPFVAWGFNYDHDRAGRLLEDYWDKEWPVVVEDFKEMKSYGANVVRIHLQTARFMSTAKRPNRAALRQLARLVTLAEETGLYLDITGLGCYHRQDVPAWYEAMTETDRWEMQARFWEAIARTCARSPAIFCYDLMNEPVLPGPGRKETDWLAGEFAGKFFVQRITLAWPDERRSRWPRRGWTGLSGPFARRTAVT